MSVPTPDPVSTVDPEVNVTAAAQNATNDANDHTPEPVQPPVVENVPAPAVTPTDPDDGIDAIRATLAELGTTVSVLAGTVASLVSKDETTRKRPWYARGGD